MTTSVRMKVARSELTFSTPILAKIAVSAAKIAESTAQNCQDDTSVAFTFASVHEGNSRAWSGYDQLDRADARRIRIGRDELLPGGEQKGAPHHRYAELVHVEGRKAFEHRQRVSGIERNDLDALAMSADSRARASAAEEIEPAQAYRCGSAGRVQHQEHVVGRRLLVGDD